MLVAPTVAITQEIPMTFTYSAQEFQFLESPISVNNGTIWKSNFTTPIDLGFTFNIAGEEVTQIQVRSGAVLLSKPNSDKTILLFALSALLEDKGISESGSPIAYEYGFSQAYDENLFKIEWKNAGVVDNTPFGSPASPTDYVNLQVWLHEKSGQVSIHFGPHQLAPNTYLLNCLWKSSVIGIKLLIGDVYIGPIGNGDQPDPWIDYCTSSTCYNNIRTYPSPGTLYTFVPAEIVSSTRQLLEQPPQAYQIYPNPTRGIISILANEKLEKESFNVEVIDTRGKVLRQYDKLSQEATADINLAALPSGIYFIKIQNAKGLTTQRIIKQ